MKNNENQLPAYVHSVSDFTSMLGLSTILQPFITAAIIATTKKSLDVDYKTSAKEILSMSPESFLSQASRTLKRRAMAAILPATLSSQVAQKYDLNNVESAALNTTFESFISGLVLREASERFNAANMQKFHVVAPNQSPKDLTKISKDEFFANLRNHPISQNFNNSDWQELKRRQNNYSNNLPFQSAALLVRNASFSASIFLTKPWAKSIYQNNREEFDSIGLSQSVAESALNNTFRAALAWITTPFDKIFTQLSSGEKSASEVISSLGKDLKNQNVSNLFKGSAGRVCLCLLTASTISEGLSFSKNLLTKIEQDEVFQDIFTASRTSATSPKTNSEEILREIENSELNLDRIFKYVSPTQAKKAFSSFGFDSSISSVVRDDFSESLKRSKDSISVMISELRNYFEKPSSSLKPKAEVSKLSEGEKQKGSEKTGR